MGRWSPRSARPLVMADPLPHRRARAVAPPAGALDVRAACPWPTSAPRGASRVGSAPPMGLSPAPSRHGCVRVGAGTSTRAARLFSRPRRARHWSVWQLMDTWARCLRRPLKCQWAAEMSPLRRMPRSATSRQVFQRCACWRCTPSCCGADARRGLPVDRFDPTLTS